MAASTETIVHPRLAALSAPDLGADAARARDETTAPSPRTPPKWLLAVLVPGVMLLVLGGRWWNYRRNHVTTDNAFVTGTIHPASARVSGTVTEVLFDDHQPVSAGAPLIRLDPRDFDIRVEQARNQVVQSAAQCDQAAAQVAQAKAHFAQAEAKSSQAAAELHRARLDVERAERLADGGARFAAISKQEWDSVKAAFEVASAAAKAAEADLQSAQALIAAAEASAAVVRAQRRSAEINLEDAELQRSYTIIPAPVAGTIGRKNVEVGQRVQPSQLLAAVVGEDKWVMANFKETQLARLRPGQRVSIRIDALPAVRLAGVVQSFSPASGAQFALLPPDNATGNFTKVVQRVPVKVVFAPESLAAARAYLVPGLSAVVEVSLAP